MSFLNFKPPGGGFLSSRLPMTAAPRAAPLGPGGTHSAVPLIFMSKYI